MFDSDKISYSDDKRRRYGKNDFILLAVCLLLAGIFFLLIKVFASPGNTVVIEYSGHVIYEHPLDDDIYVIIETAEGSDTSGIPNPVITEVTGDSFDAAVFHEGCSYMNILHISDGKADMMHADCPDQICVNSRPISRSGESIVCLPHRIVVNITGEKKDTGSEYDAVTW